MTPLVVAILAEQQAHLKDLGHYFVTKIMVQVLNILQLLQSDSNKAERVSYCCANKFPLIETPSEKYLEKLIGKTDIEDALKMLGRERRLECLMRNS